ncbi:cytochrome P450 [Exidia glandulosa HHB12029]|uniref:Cytochrome P450 n=1 Tax=Exidia glandulosa HHB12029 TaxID=1314781 RepID=A0A165HPD8_EXIGL|nr:cytochrome P450 [Exidia glandulosa HHB12029]
MSSTTVVFHLHGRDASSTGVAIVVPNASDFKELQNIVAPKFNILDPLRISFCKSSDRAGLTHALEPVSAILAERTVGILVDEQTPRLVPGPEGGLPIIGGYSELYPDFLGNYQRLLDKYGHMAHVAYMGKHVYLTDDPDIVTHVLHEGEFFKKEITEEHPLFPLKLVIPIGLFTIDSSDPRWEQSHKLLMAALSARAMRNYVKIMDRSNDGLTKNVLSKFAESGDPFNVFPWMLRTAAQTIGEVSLNLDLGMLSGPDADVAQIFKDINMTLKLSQDLVRKGKWYRNLPNPEARAQAPIKKRQFEFIQDLVRQSVAKGTPDMPYQKAATSTESILDFMVHALDEDGNKLSIELLVDDVLTFLGAGQVTTSSALSWLCYTLSHHKDKAEKLYESLLDAGLTADGEITAEHLSNLEYLDWYVKETQRLYNPAFQPTRQALQDVVLPGGYMVPKGAQVTVALHSIHVNKEHWTDPYKFNPERWGTEEVRKRHKNAYIPFATGARGCIGFAFALQEMKLVIARVVLNFTIKDVTHGPVVYDPDFSIYRPLNFMATVAKRPPPGERKTAPKSAEPPSPVQEEAPKVGNLDLPKLYVCVSLCSIGLLAQTHDNPSSMAATTARRRASHRNWSGGRRSSASATSR